MSNGSPALGLFFLTILALASCTTTNSSSSSEDNKLQFLSQPSRKTSLIPSTSRTEWLEVLNNSKDTSEINRIKILLGIGEAKEAERKTRVELEKKPGDVTLLRLLAVSYAMQKNYTMAAYYGGLVLQTARQDAVALNLRALNSMYLSHGKDAFEKTLQLFQEAHAVPDQIAGSLNYGEYLLQMGRPAQAMEVFTVVRTRCDDCPQSLYGEGVAAARAGDLVRSESALEKLISKDPKHFRARFQLALVYGKKDKNKQLAQLQSILADPNLKDDQVRQRSNALIRSTKAAKGS